MYQPQWQTQRLHWYMKQMWYIFHEPNSIGMKTGTEQGITTVLTGELQDAWDMYQGHPPRPRIIFLEFKDKGMNMFLNKQSTS